MGKTLTGFDTSDPKFDRLKYIRQLRSVVKWKRSKARATIVAATGFGKSVICLIIIAKLFKRDTNSLRYGRSILVVVPTTDLKRQWEKVLLRAGFSNIEVLVINTVALQDGFTRNVDLLIVDEAHLFAAEKFKRIFHRVKYSFLACTTATLERLDGKEVIIEHVAPVCDTITQKEAIAHGWISDFVEFNLAVPVTRQESEMLVKLGKTIQVYMSKFADFNYMISCMNRGNAQVYAQNYNSGRRAEDQISPNDVVKWATLGMRAVHKRKDFLDNTEHKIRATVELIEEFDVRTVTFSQSTAFANALGNHFGQKGVVYHSSLESELRKVPKEKVYKTHETAIRNKIKLEKDSKNSNVAIEPVENGYRITWLRVKPFSGNKLRIENMEKFLSKAVDLLFAAKAIDQGFDDSSIVFGIDASKSEAPTQYIQRTGRIARNHLLSDGSFAKKVYVNLYVPDWSVPRSRDEKKLRKAQSKSPERVVWVDDMNELKFLLGSIFKKREQ